MAGIDRRGVLRLAGATGVAGLTAGWGASACSTGRDLAEPEPLYDSHVRIGMLVPEAGGYRSIGDDIVNGFRRFLAANDNRIGGHPFVIHQADEGETPEDALAGLEVLLAQNIHAVVGVVTSAALLAVSTTVESRNVPLLGANGSPQELPNVPYVWRTSYVNQEPGFALGTHLAGSVSDPVAMVVPDEAAGTDGVAGLREAFAQAGASGQLGEPIVTAANRQPDEGFFAPQLAQVQALGPQAVFCSYAGAAAVEFVRGYVAADMDPRLLHATGDLTEGVVLDELDELGVNAVGITTSANYAPGLLGAANRAFAVNYQAEFGRPPSSYAVAGYDAAVALDKAVRLTEGDPTPRTINQMLSEVGIIDSPRGQWQFNQNRTPTQKWYLREVADDGPVVSNVVVRELGTLG